MSARSDYLQALKTELSTVEKRVDATGKRRAGEVKDLIDQYTEKPANRKIEKA